MKKVIMLLGVALIAGVAVLLMTPKDVTKEAEQTNNSVAVKQPTEGKKPSNLYNAKTTKSASDVTKDDSPSELEQLLRSSL